MLEGLESASPGLFAPLVETSDLEGAEAELDAAELSRIVLKVEGRIPISTGPFRSMGMVPLGENEDRQFFVLTTSETRALFAELVGRYDDDNAWTDPKSWREALDKIERISVYDRADRTAPDLELPAPGDVAVVDVILWPTSLTNQGADAEAARRVVEIDALVADARTHDDRVGILWRDERPDSLQVRVVADTSLLDELLELPIVEVVRGPLGVEVTSETLSRGQVPRGAPADSGVAIGVLDDLVIDNPWLRGLVTARAAFPNGMTFSASTAHGTQVAGIAAWGNVTDLLHGQPSQVPHQIYAVQIADADRQGRATLVGAPSEVVEEALRWLHAQGARIAVLAYSLGYPDDGPLPSELSAVIDTLAAELDMVIVTAAGNIGQEQLHPKHMARDYPDYFQDPTAKIAAPGSAAIALTVGSVAHTHVPDTTRPVPAMGIARRFEASPFSRTGPSRGSNAAGRQKPEFAADGGNYGYIASTDQFVHDDANLGITTLIPPVAGRLFASASGTSYAAPRIANEVATILGRYPGSSANLLRCLTALAAETVPDTLARATAPQHSTYGRVDAARVLESGGNRVVFVYEGVIATGEQELLAVPIPAAFAAGRSQRELRVALAFDPPVRRSRRDYVAGKMSFELYRKHPFADLKQRLERQPSRSEIEEDDSLEALGLPSKFELRPPKTHVSADTLICRAYRRNGWDPDDEHYFLGVLHEHSPWSQGQRDQYTEQRYAVAIQIIDSGRPNVDLYAQAVAEINALARGAARTRARGQR